MGLIANYQYLSDKDLKALKAFDTEDEDDIFETVEDWNDEAEILLDIDKMWDLLHYMMTGITASEPLEDDPLSEAVVGVTSIEKIEDFIAYIEKDRVSDILKALEDFDMESALESFSLEEGKEAELYPNIWDYDDEEDEIKEDLLDCFERMKEFYKEILEVDGNVLVTIY